MSDALPVLTAPLQAAYEVSGTSLVSRAKAFETEIGDVKQAEFFPQVKIKRFANEANLSVRLVSAESAVLSYENNAVVWTTPTLEARFYDVGGLTEGGGFEFAITLTQAPASNVLTFSLATKGLEFLYQPPLKNTNEDGSTWELNPYGGARRRPASVNGSYAVYARGLSGDHTALGGQNYQVGKLCHIHRPWAEDAKGQRVWCDLAIDEVVGLLTITVPPEFLASAVYPVLVDPTFGYTSTGASDDNPYSGHMFAKAFSTPASNGTITSITIIGRNKTGTAAQFCPALYSDTASAPITRLAAVNSGGTTFTGSDASVTTSISVSVTSGTQYWLGIKGATGADPNSNDFFWKFDTATGELHYGNFNNPIIDWPTPAVEGTTANERISVYATYTATGNSSSVSPSVSPSASLSPSASASPSSSVSPSPSPSPSAGDYDLLPLSLIVNQAVKRASYW
jgi:hypothetical protein